MHSFQKHPRLNADKWTKAVIYLLKTNDNRCKIEDIYKDTCVEQSVFTESILVEHPSIALKNSYVTFRPFCQIDCPDETLKLVRSFIPRCVRDIDLHGLYEFVDEDLNELIFNLKIHRIENYSSLTILPICEKASSLFVKEWMKA